MSEAHPRPRARPGEILKVLARAIRTASLYTSDHPVMVEAMGQLQGLITQFLANAPSLRISIHEDTFFVESTVLLDESLQLYPVLLDLKEREIGAVEFSAGVEPSELTRLVEALALRPGDLRARGGAAALLRDQQVIHIAVAPLEPLSEGKRDELQVDARDAYRATLRVIDELNFQASREVPLELRKARVVVGSLADILHKDKVALLGMAALRNYDEDTCHHCVNVSILALTMGLHLELDRVLLTTLGMAALLHDIGKTRIPREILNKAAKLTSAEMDIVRRHTYYGAYLLRNLPGLARLAMVVAFEHHANYDLSGYPRITAKKVPHLFSRVVSLADFLDASTSARRTYRRAMLPYESMSYIMEWAGKTFDPILARLFVHTLGRHPVGSLVELDTGELASVTQPGRWSATRPMVRVFTNRTREQIEPYTVTLEETPDRRIVRPVDPMELELDGSVELLFREAS